MLCVTVWPFVKSARLLLAAGYPADAIVEMWRPNTDEFALRGQLGTVAATVIDGETARPAPRTGRLLGFRVWPLSTPSVSHAMTVEPLASLLGEPITATSNIQASPPFART